MKPVFHVIKIVPCSILLLIVLSLTSCTLPVGTTNLYRVEHKDLKEPLQPPTTDLQDPATIYRENTDGAAAGSDVFSIYLTDAYLKYLKDLGSMNEVVIVAEFTEAVTGDKNKDTVVKILGPYNGVADRTGAPLLNKLLYGPKKMQSDVLSMKLEVYEYDQGENEDSAALLDFIATSGEALGLANPVTLAEIAVTKEIAKSLIMQNDNDLVLSIEMDFVAGGNNIQWPVNRNVNTLPLRAGELVLIKREACRIGSCFDYFSNKGKNKFGYLSDVVMALPNAIVQATSDVPDYDSLKPTDYFEIKSDALGLNQILDNKREPYNDKTWLRLAVFKGGDHSRWEMRRKLWEVEANITNLIRQNAPINADKVKDAGNLLQEVVKMSVAAPAIRLTSPQLINGVQYVESGGTSFSSCLTMPSQNTEVKVQSPGFTVSAQGAPAGQKCYLVTPQATGTSLEKGTYLLNIGYTQEQKAQATALKFVIADKASLGNMTCSLQGKPADPLDQLYTISANVTNADIVFSWQIVGATYPFTHIDGKAQLKDVKISAEESEIALKTVFGSVTAKVTCPKAS